MGGAKNSGVTAIELLVVIGIIGFIASFAIPAYGVIQKSLVLSNTTDEIVNALRDAQNRAIASQHNSPYGVQFNQHNYVLFRNDPSLGRVDEATNTLSSDLEVAAASQVTVLFNRLTGITTAATINVGFPSGSQKTIQVDAVGRISLQ